MPTGRALIEDVNECSTPHGSCALWWMGQQSFILKMGSVVLYLDPFLSDVEGRLVAPMLKPQDVRNASFVLGTHDHIDHIDRGSWPAIADASKDAVFVVPDLLRESLSQETGISPNRFAGLNDGLTYESRGIRISAVAAAHEFLDRDDESGRYPYLGYIIEGNGCVVYHAGDTCRYEGLVGKLRRWPIGAAILPINGRDAARLRRNIIGNMTYQEAADLAGELEPGVTIPAHFDMFGHNGADPQPFIEYMNVKYPRLKAIVCEHGRRTMIAAR
jgi:L-ascorbate 6-phosphate lactonase